MLQLKYQTFNMGAPRGGGPIHAIQLTLLTYCPPCAHFTSRVTTFKLSHIQSPPSLLCFWTPMRLPAPARWPLIPFSLHSNVHLGVCVKIVFIYHVSYGSLLVRCHRVVNKGCRLPCLRLRRALRLAFVPPVLAHPTVHLLKVWVLAQYLVKIK